MKEFCMREVSDYVFKSSSDTTIRLDTVIHEHLSINDLGIITINLTLALIPFDFMRTLAIVNETTKFWEITKETIVRWAETGEDKRHDLQIYNAVVTFEHDSKWENDDPPRSKITIIGNIRNEILEGINESQL